ncbi:MAG TPA: oligoendopeptidase F, partial [Burkholderiaceae bacterium]|nr:oligoendopeptidase F [Burkholderiaceae bacterium]
MTLRAFAFVLLLGPVVSAPAETPADRWNLGDLYPTSQAWSADAARLEAQMTELARCKGQLGKSAARLRQCLELRADATQRGWRLAVYAWELLAEDTGVDASIALSQQAERLRARFDEAVAFFEPEIQRLGAARVRRFVAQEPALEVHRHPLDRTLRAAP